MKKRCNRCGKLKSTDQFYGRKRLSPYCKPCTRAYEAERYGHDYRKQQIKDRTEVAKQRNREQLWAYLLAHPCVDCGNDDPIILEFDHVRGKRHRCVASMLTNSYAWETILQEIAKCDVVCANCHTRRTLTRAKSWRLVMPARPPKVDYRLVLQAEHIKNQERAMKEALLGRRQRRDLCCR